MLSTLIIYICLIPVFWIIQNLIHEGSHLLIAKKFGAIKLKLIPWPTKQKGKWIFAYCEWDNTRRLTNIEKIKIYQAPLTFNSVYSWILIFSCFIYLFIYHNCSYFILFLMIFPFVDLVTSIYSYWFGSPRTDGQKIKRLLE